MHGGDAAALIRDPRAPAARDASQPTVTTRRLPMAPPASQAAIITRERSVTMRSANTASAAPIR